MIEELIEFIESISLSPEEFERKEEELRKFVVGLWEHGYNKACCDVS